jgi:NADH-quinone oxidoreductase subunit L
MRLLFLVFHGESRVDKHTEEHLHETAPSITVPLILLAIPSVVIGYFTIEPMLFGGWLDNGIYIDTSHESVENLKHHFHSAFSLISHSVMTLPFWMMVGGIATAWLFSLYRTEWADVIQRRFKRINYVLVSLYGFDRFNEIIFVRGALKLGNLLWKISDMAIIDQLLVNGSARFARFVGSFIRPVQTGYVYHYAFFMIISLMLVLGWVLVASDYSFYS